LDLTLPPTGNADVRIHLIADASLSLSAISKSEPELYAAKDEDGADVQAYRQKTAVTLTASASGELLFAGGIPSGLEWDVVVKDPSGKPVDVDIDPARCVDGKFAFDFCPESFGDYAFALSVSSGGIRLAATASSGVPAAELPFIEEEPRDYTIWIVSGAGALLILASCVFFVFAGRRRKERAYAAELPDAEDGLPKAFTGKLDIYAIVVDGGGSAIPALTFRLGDMADRKWARLSAIFERSGVPYRYPAAEDIRFRPKPGGALLVKNHSDAVVYCGGQAYRSGGQATLTFGQKIYVVFEEGVNEYEIYYHAAAETTVSGRSLHMELAD
jgi:hypothetical protein